MLTPNKIFMGARKIDVEEIMKAGVDYLNITISRESVINNNFEEAMHILRQLTSNIAVTKYFCERVDISFDGYNETSEELWEIPEVRNYVLELDNQFPYWLYFLSKNGSGLYTIIKCFLLPFLKPEAEIEINSKKLQNYMVERGLLAMNHLCELAQLTKEENIEMTNRVMNYLMQRFEEPDHRKRQEKTKFAIAMMAKEQKYQLRIYDNFHYMDESETYNSGDFETYDEALNAAKKIVDDFLIHNWKPGMTESELYDQYTSFGEDPMIIPVEHDKHEKFSALDYAKTSVKNLCSKLENKSRKVQTLYQNAIKFATEKHLEKGQKVPGTDLPYVVHLSNVAMEIMAAALHSDNFNLDFAVQVALLHDTVEDTETPIEEIEKVFGFNIAMAVSALTKNNDLPKEKQMQDSLKRIKKLGTEVWAVKIADRITNLQPPPPHWDNFKKIKYQEEAKVILRELREGNYFLSKRLEEKIEEYENYTND
jgi:guanosine-3',5'-bis(diphosphate) 3'-pyrophosphohydrolase